MSSHDSKWLAPIMLRIMYTTVPPITRKTRFFMGSNQFSFVGRLFLGGEMTYWNGLSVFSKDLER